MEQERNYEKMFNFALLSSISLLLHLITHTGNNDAINDRVNTPLVIRINQTLRMFKQRDFIFEGYGNYIETKPFQIKLILQYNP
jgi:hypothetical protein